MGLLGSIAFLTGALVLFVCLGGTARADDPPRLLVFTKMAAYVHTTVPGCLKNLRALCEANAIAVDDTDDAGLFTDEGLKPYRAVVFLSTSGNLFTPEQRDAFVRYIHNGGGFAGLHAASTSERQWPWFKGLIGAYFSTHPWVQTATVRVVDPAHPAVRGLPAQWQRSDEWYVFQEPPRDVQLLLEVSETRWHGEGISETGTHAGPIPPVGSEKAVIPAHPIAWCHEYEGGRAFYTAMGHFAEAYTEPEMQTHLLAGIRWAAHLDGK